jgi:hypothetical protein
MSGWREGAAQYAGGASRYSTPADGNVVNSARSLMSAAYSDNSEAAAFAETWPRVSESWDLLAAKEGELPEVTQVLETQTFTKNISDLSVILPYTKTSQLVIQEERFTFLPTLAQKQAERTRPRTVQTKKTSLRKYLEQFHIGFMIPFSALTTAVGQQLYVGGLVQMRNAMRETIGLSILYELQTYELASPRVISCPVCAHVKHSKGASLPGANSMSALETCVVAR